MPVRLATALGVALGGGVSELGLVVAQATAGDGLGASEVVSGAILTSLVGALVYLARKLTDGKLVHVDVGTLISTMASEVEHGRLRDEAAVAREERMIVLLESTNQTLGRTSEVLAQIAREQARGA